MKKIVTGCLSVILILLLASCASNEISASGRINYYSQDGGFYGITTRAGDKYEPLNLSPEFQRKFGYPVSFKARILEYQTGGHNWGTVVEILAMEVDYSIC